MAPKCCSPKSSDAMATMHVHWAPCDMPTMADPTYSKMGTAKHKQPDNTDSKMSTASLEKPDLTHSKMGTARETHPGDKSRQVRV